MLGFARVQGDKQMKILKAIILIIAIVAVFCNMAMETEIRNLKAENYELRQEIEKLKEM